MRSLFYVPTRAEEETRRRIKLSIAAYHYEIITDGREVMTNHEFDSECLKVDLSINTNRPDLDEWWRQHFSPHTGSWIGSHPEQFRLKELYYEHYHSKR